MRKLLILAVSFLCILCVWGCAKKQLVKPQGAAPAAETTPAPAPAASQDEPSSRFTDWQPVPQLKTVYYDFDSSDLLPASRDTLKRNAEYLKANTGIQVLVEGNCDERGTFEYNMALGQRRADAVREYLSGLGVEPGRIGTISYGQEKPAVEGNDEAAWAKNRRADLKIRNNK
jgi:peptidoglycan-associated lipoprotein